MSKKNNPSLFAVYHSWLMQIHLDKDIFQIPTLFKTVYNTNSYIVWYFRDKELTDFDKICPWLKTIKLKNRWGWGMYDNAINIDIIRYLIFNSKKIDIINLSHIIKTNILYGFIYKFFNPRGKIYIKMDFDYTAHKKETTFRTKYKFLNIFVDRMFNKFLSICDCISVETKEWYDFLIDLNHRFKDNLVYMPNGYNDTYINKYVWHIKTYEEKENIIVTVWRIWTHQKNTEMLLETLKDTNLKDWKVYIIWPIEDEFQNYIDNFFENNQKLKEKIIFTWPIYDRDKLYDFYNRAKIFCLTSRYESFGIVMVEAMSFWDYIITTDVSSAKDITDNNNIWKIIKDWKDFKNTLSEIIEDESIIKNKYGNIIRYARENFAWSKIIKIVGKKLWF